MSSMADGKTIAVLGAGGLMGLPMARNLARDGFAVRAWNRSRDKAEQLADDGAEVLDTPAEAMRGADIVLTMLANADVVLETIGDALAGADDADGLLWLQMSTVGIDGIERCRSFAEDHGIALLDCPVLGSAGPAQQRKLVMLASGEEQLREWAQPVFDALGHRTIWVGAIGLGTRLKLATNSWVLSVVETGAETLALADGLGVDPQLVLDALEGGPLELPYLEMKGKAMLERSFEPQFKLALAAKDAGLVADAIEANGLDLPVLRAIRDRLAEGVPAHGDEDMAATFLTSLAGARS
jgi:3-hydroxyisobutyrate dehydrogenase